MKGDQLSVYFPDPEIVNVVVLRPFANEGDEIIDSGPVPLRCQAHKNHFMNLPSSLSLIVNIIRNNAYRERNVVVRMHAIDVAVFGSYGEKGFFFNRRLFYDQLFELYKEAAKAIFDNDRGGSPVSTITFVAVAREYSCDKNFSFVSFTYDRALKDLPRYDSGERVTDTISRTNKMSTRIMRNYGQKDYYKDVTSKVCEVVNSNESLQNFKNDINVRNAGLFEELHNAQGFDGAMVRTSGTILPANERVKNFESALERNFPDIDVQKMTLDSRNDIKLVMATNGIIVCFTVI